MSHLPRWWLPLLALLAAPAVAAANDAHARAARALAIATHRPPPPPTQEVDEYSRLRSRAIAENRPLLVWVGFRRADLELARPDCLHYHCAAFAGAAPPCVVVGRPGGGELWRDADLPAANADALRPLVSPPRVCGPDGCR